MAAGEGGGGPAGDNLTLRGFGARNDIFVDGIRDFASYTRDTFNVEQVEVVKGPASAQTGRGSTGGYINLFSKQPQARYVRERHGRRRPARITSARPPTSTSAATSVGLGGGTALRRQPALPRCRHARPRLCRDASASASRRRSRSASAPRPARSCPISGCEQDNVPDYGIPFVPSDQHGVFPSSETSPRRSITTIITACSTRDYEKTRSQHR